MSNFDWETADGVALETVTDDVATKRRFTPLTLILLFIILLGIAGVIYWQVRSRFESVQTDVKADVQATHQLVQQALSQQDSELFHNLLSEQDPSWTQMQEQLFRKGLLLDRDPFGMHLIATDGTEQPNQATVRLSTNLQTAEVVAEHQYTVATQPGTTETVTLQQTTTYHKLDNKWVIAPPTERYWGEWVTDEQDLLTVVYPRHDQEVAERLAVDLNTALAEMCQVVMGLDCPDDFHLQLRLENDPTTLLAVDDIHFIVNSGANLQLPTPTLVGLPANEKAYAALRRGYAAQVATAGMTELLDYECCQHGLFYRAYIEKQLDRLGLRPWPLMPVDYQQLSENGLYYPEYFEAAGLRGQRSLDIPKTEAWQLVFAQVDFLAEEFPPELINNSIEQGPEAFLPAMGYHSYRFIQEWSEFVYSRSLSPLPGETNILPTPTVALNPTTTSLATSTPAPLSIPPALPGWVWSQREWAGYAFMRPQSWSYEGRYADDAYQSPETTSQIVVSTKPYAAEIEANSYWRGYPAQWEVDEGGGGSRFEVIFTIVGDNRTFILHFFSASPWPEAELQIFRTMIETFLLRGASKEGVYTPVNWETEQSPAAYSIRATVLEVMPEAGILVLVEPVEGFITLTLVPDGQLQTEGGTAIGWEDIEAGAQVQATGEVGEAGTLLAQEIYLVEPDE